MKAAEYYKPYPDGSLRCKPGNVVFPKRCGWHMEHYWCDTCEGFYGVAHDNIHEGRTAHPMLRPHGCACRPCRNEVARRERERAS